jgi:hypothetical protein
MLILRILTVFVILCLASAQAAQVTAQLSGNTVEAGQGVMLTLQVEGGSVQGNPVFPQVENLIINQRGKSQQMRIVNGKMSGSVTYSYVVGSMQPGDYVIPAATVKVGGKEFKTQALKLTVRPGANGAPAGLGDKGESGDAEENSGNHGFLSFQLATKERDHVYPSEIAPVRIKAFFPMDTNVSLNGPPRPEGSAFTLHNLTEQPQQTTEMVNGRRYRAVTWFGGLSATKAGEYPANFELEARVAVRETPAKRGGSIFDLYGNMVEKEVVLSIESPPSIKVLELPMEGRPDDFTGAIGEFGFESVGIPGALEVGEPFRIEAVLKGSGNFSLLKAPHPLPADDWKVYDGKSEFAAQDAASFSGRKRFRFNAVPLMPDKEEVSLGFSYFDPEKGEYQRVVSPPRKVVITGESAKPVEVVEAGEPVPDKPEGPQLAPLRTEFGSVQDYRALSTREWFMPVIGGSIVLTFGILGFGWWKGRGVDHAKVARLANEAAAREALSNAERAAAEGDGAVFFTAAREVIRIRVAMRTGIRPEAVTSADLHDLEEAGVSEILKEADRIDYSGEAVTPEALGEWKICLDRGLDKLT